MDTVRIKTINDYNDIVAQEALHPLISVIDFANAPVPTEPPQASSYTLDFYAVFLKQDQNCTIRYGRNKYDYQQGTLVFIAPGQVIRVEGDPEEYQAGGHALLFHPDLIRGTSLGQNINLYNFFSYDVHEALHLSKRERQLVLDCFNKIEH